MEILKHKKIIVGSLAVIGGIALVAYLLKPKGPRRNSEGFFNAGGMTVPNLPNNLFGIPISPKPTTGIPVKPISIGGSCNLPDTFVRQVVTNVGIIKTFCGRYDRVVAMTPMGKGFEYRLRPEIPSATFVNGGFVNSNGTNIVTTYQVISSSDYESAFINGLNC